MHIYRCAFCVLLLGLLVGCSDPELRQECLVNTDCPKGMQCSARNCVALDACPADNQTRCGDLCVVTSSDVEHCGSCDPCPALANARALSCIQGQCQYECEAGYRDADGDLSMAPLGTGCECPPGQACDTCPQECGASEVCREGRCVQVECVDDTPCALPEPTCEGNSVMSWSGSGACVDNTCDRQLTATPCGPRQVCQSGACVDVTCTLDAQCSPPAPTCEGQVLVSYSAPSGTCVDNLCSFQEIEQRTDCASQQRVCQGAACADLCAEVTCPPPGDPYCVQNERVTPLANACDWQTGQCVVQEQREACNEAGLQCSRGHCVPYDTVVIPAGAVALSPQTTNTISRPFLMQTTEVTRQDYGTLLMRDPSLITTSQELPVHNLAWADATAYSRELSLRDRLDPCYTTTGAPLYDPISDCAGWRLPTASEFQHAYRAGTETHWYCGDDAACLVDTAHCGLYTDYAEVRGLAPNPWGLYDMAGNVGEWVHDWHGTVPVGDIIDWAGPQEGTLRYLAGGNAGVYEDRCMADSLSLQDPGMGYRSAGFRLVRTLHAEPR